MLLNRLLDAVRSVALDATLLRRRARAQPERPPLVETMLRAWVDARRIRETTMPTSISPIPKTMSMMSSFSIGLRGGSCIGMGTGRSRCIMG